MDSNVDFELTGSSEFLNTLHTCLILLGFVSPFFVSVHDALDVFFVDTSACMLDVWSFVLRTSAEDGVLGAAVLMFLPIISVCSPRTISAPENIKEH